eukprot:gb/GFBE01019945.1/.p1 GENE.gb/GFBE01019945.1/~~gb/GFBE01019945.1/.p1  ORF type:complete len:371 (+),score=46.05 gb/GFBE01019945.1/:1-1113(+)
MIRGYLIPLESTTGEAVFLLPAGGRVTIGRKASCFIKCQDEMVSGVHCVVRSYLKEDGSPCFQVEDTSTNGTYVNYTRVEKGKHVQIAAGSTLSLVRPSSIANGKKGVHFRLKLERVHEDAEDVSGPALGQAKHTHQQAHHHQQQSAALDRRGIALSQPVEQTVSGMSQVCKSGNLAGNISCQGLNVSKPADPSVSWQSRGRAQLSEMLEQQLDDADLPNQKTTRLDSCQTHAISLGLRRLPGLCDADIQDSLHMHWKGTVSMQSAEARSAGRSHLLTGADPEPLPSSVLRKLVTHTMIQGRNSSRAVEPDSPVGTADAAAEAAPALQPPCNKQPGRRNLLVLPGHQPPLKRQRPRQEDVFTDQKRFQAE